MPYQHPQQGEGFFDALKDAASWVGDKISKGVKFAKDAKLISAALGAIPETKAFAPAVSAIGFGKKKKTKRKSKSGSSTRSGGKTGGRKRKAKK